MGKEWDGSGVAFDPEFWRHCYRVLKPGGWLLAFGGSRTSHRMACAIEDAGFELRDTIMWLYGSGFPKSHQHLKPAFEPIVVARKPPEGSIAANVERHGCGGLNIDGCRIPCEPIKTTQGQSSAQQDGEMYSGRDQRNKRPFESHSAGRWPANVCHDGSDEVLAAFAAFGEKTIGKPGPDGHRRNQPPGNGIYGGGKGLFQVEGPAGMLYGDTGSAARFFYQAKASKADRGEGNGHPTVKPTALMEWLVKLVSPHGGPVLDPFAGSGTTGVACARLGVAFTGVEQNEAYCEIAARRLDAELDAHAGKLFA